MKNQGKHTVQPNFNSTEFIHSIFEFMNDCIWKTEGILTIIK